MPLVSATPSELAMMRAELWATNPFTRPAVSTLALALVLDHVIARPVRVLPPASLSTATSWIVPSRGMSAVSGVRVTEATGGATTTVVESQMPSQVLATSHAEPGLLSTVTAPVGPTVAIVRSRETHPRRMRPENAPPPCTVPAARMLKFPPNRTEVSRGASASAASAESGAEYHSDR